VKRLAERKQLLIAQSEAHRLLIQLECRNLLKPAGRVAEVMRSYGWVLGAVAGLMLVQRGRSVGRWLFRGVEVWRLIRRFFKS
jgi:hypothetical protein